MSDFRRKNRTFLFKIEDPAGTDAEPVVGSNAIKAEDPSGSAAFELDETNEVTGSLSGAARYTGGGTRGFTVPVLLKGSGTAGQAPEAGPLYRAAAHAETLLAAAVTDVLQAGSTTNTLVVADGDIPADGDFVGMVVELTSGTYDGYTGVITGSVASTDTLTVYPPIGGSPAEGDGYSIHACALYVPASDGLEVGTGYLYKHSSVADADSILEAGIGMAADCQINIPVRRVGRATFTLTGKLVAPVDVTAPGVATYSTASAPVLVAARSFLGGTAIKYSEVSFNSGNEVSPADDPSEAFGYDIAGVVGRRVNGRINPRMAHMATRNAFADIVDGTTRPLWLDFGSASGRRISIYCPACRFVQSEDVDNRGFSHEGLDFDCTGIDSEIYVCFH